MGRSSTNESSGAHRRYRDKRDFRRSPEPPGEGEPRVRKRGNPIFVVQHHKASTEHFDFRLEVDGVLCSWAVPKGPSTDPKQKRLAVHVEDHPLDYADFEGTIPKDQYGGGTVVVWDAGPYRNTNQDEDGQALSMADALKRGKVDVWLEGKKLRGGFSLVKTRRLGGNKEGWLLIKRQDEGADARRNPVGTQPESVLSGHTVESIANEAQR